jgi:hypothetical protein
MNREAEPQGDQSIFGSPERAIFLRLALELALRKYGNQAIDRDTLAGEGTPDEQVKPEREVVRRVGTCSHCGGAVLLRVKALPVGRSREARCSCGATVISPGFFALPGSPGRGTTTKGVKDEGQGLGSNLALAGGGSARLAGDAGRRSAERSARAVG